MRLACYDSAGAMAQVMSKDDFKAGKDKIGAEYKTAKATCDSLSGNANDICKAQAKGNEKVALAELEATYKPTVKNRYEARVAKAEADYGVASEKCDDLAGNAKDVCIKEAKAAQTTAKADDVFHAAVIDVSAEKRAEDKVCQLSLAVEQTTQSVVITDLTGNIEYANAACMAISGYSHDR